MQPPARNLAWWAKHHFAVVRAVSFLLWLSPSLWLAGEWATDSLGINPLDRLLRVTGLWALVMLIVTLSVTPLRRASVRFAQHVHARYGKRLADWNWLIRLRRQLGLFSFYYAVLHLGVYVTFDAGFELAAVRDDLGERPFITVGMIAFVLLVPLAATSTNFAMRTLGAAWRQLHMLSYGVAALGLAHFWMQMKVGVYAPLPYTLAIAGLWALRLRAWRAGDRQPATEAPERPSSS